MPSDKVVRRLRASSRTRRSPVSVAVILEDKLVWAEGLGLANVEHNVPVTPETLFRIASISKSLTSAAVGILHERGLLDLDESIRTYLPSFPDKGDPITTRQLGGHLSGIPHYTPEDLVNHVAYGSAIEAIDKFKDRPALFEPGARFEYSSFGYNLIGAIVETVSGKPFLMFMEEEVFQPLGMRHTLADKYREIIANRAGTYELSETNEITIAPFTDNSDLWAAGGFLSTPTDLVTFGQGLLRGDLLRLETLEVLFTSMKTDNGTATGYGLGWEVIEDDGERLLMHSGGHFGAASWLMMWQRRGLILAITTNLSMSSDTFSTDLVAPRNVTARAFLSIEQDNDHST